jgi:hypothetical protein
MAILSVSPGLCSLASKVDEASFAGWRTKFKDAETRDRLLAIKHQGDEVSLEVGNRRLLLPLFVHGGVAVPPVPQ